MKKWIIILTAIIFTACGTIEMDIPEGFAHLDQDETYTLISSDHIKVRAYPVEVDKKENIDLKLLAKEMGLVLKSKGHFYVKSEKIETQSGFTGIYSEYTSYYNGEKYLYGVTLITDKEKLYVIESGGEEKEYEARKADIKKAIKTFRVN